MPQIEWLNTTEIYFLTALRFRGQNQGVGKAMLSLKVSGKNPSLLLSSSAATATAAAKSLQPCPTLCDPIDGSPLGSSVPGILQARTLEWVAISFSNAGK